LNEQSEDDFSTVDLKSEDARDFKKHLFIGHSACLSQSCSQFGIAELNEDGLQKNKTRFDIT
jgi:hypothetical protein